MNKWNGINCKLSRYIHINDTKLTFIRNKGNQSRLVRESCQLALRVVKNVKRDKWVYKNISLSSKRKFWHRDNRSNYWLEATFRQFNPIRGVWVTAYK